MITEVFMINDNKPINYKNLFELWANFDDKYSVGEVTQMIETKGLGTMDAISFTAFCYGYEQALKIASKEGKHCECDK